MLSSHGNGCPCYSEFILICSYDWDTFPMVYSIVWHQRIKLLHAIGKTIRDVLMALRVLKPSPSQLSMVILNAYRVGVISSKTAVKISVLQMMKKKCLKREQLMSLLLCIVKASVSRLCFCKFSRLCLYPLVSFCLVVLMTL